MRKIIVEVDDNLNDILTENAKRQNISVETLIVQLLNTYAIPSHIMQGEDIEKGYVESGEINLQWANLK